MPWCLSITYLSSKPYLTLVNMPIGLCTCIHHSEKGIINTNDHAQYCYVLVIIIRVSFLLGYYCLTVESYQTHYHTTPCRDLDFNPNKQYYMATCGDDGYSRFWDVRNPSEPAVARADHSHW
jgi:WD40 repeat protein